MDDLIKAQAEIEQNKPQVIEKLLQYSLTDTLIFWGTEKDLIKEQEKTWAPILKWVNKVLETEIKYTSSLDIPPSNKKSGHRIKSFLTSLTTKELTAFYKASLLMKSVLLAMAFVKGHINADQAFKAALLEELWQNKSWATTQESQEEQEKLKNELIEIQEFLNA